VHAVTLSRSPEGHAFAALPPSLGPPLLSLALVPSPFASAPPSSTDTPVSGPTSPGELPELPLPLPELLDEDGGAVVALPLASLLPPATPPSPKLPVSPTPVAHAASMPAAPRASRLIRK